MSDQGHSVHTSAEYEIDMQLAAIIRKMVAGTASVEDMQSYNALLIKRAHLMRPTGFGKTVRMRRGVGLKYA